MAFLRNVTMQTYNSNIFFRGFSPALNSLFAQDNIEELPLLQNQTRTKNPTPSYYFHPFPENT